MIAITIFIAGFPRLRRPEVSPGDLVASRAARFSERASSPAIQGACQLPQCNVNDRFAESGATPQQTHMKPPADCAFDEK
jgi:hypothetical protein